MKNRKAEMWLRRVVSSVILVAIVVAIVFLAVKGVMMVASKLTETHTSAAAQSVPTAVSIADCSGDDLEITSEADPASPVVGEGFTVTLSAENRSAHECALNTGDLDVRLKTGDDTVWRPNSCLDEDDRQQLLLIPNNPWTTTLTWDGKWYESCEVLTDAEGTAKVADAGTYRLQVAVGGDWQGSPLVIEVQ